MNCIYKWPIEKVNEQVKLMLPKGSKILEAVRKFEHPVIYTMSDVSREDQLEERYFIAVETGKIFGNDEIEQFSDRRMFTRVYKHIGTVTKYGDIFVLHLFEVVKEELQNSSFHGKPNC